MFPTDDSKAVITPTAIPGIGPTPSQSSFEPLSLRKEYIYDINNQPINDVTVVDDSPSSIVNHSLDQSKIVLVPQPSTYNAIPPSCSSFPESRPVCAAPVTAAENPWRSLNCYRSSPNCYENVNVSCSYPTGLNDYQHLVNGQDRFEHSIGVFPSGSTCYEGMESISLDRNHLKSSTDSSETNAEESITLPSLLANIRHNLYYDSN